MLVLVAACAGHEYVYTPEVANAQQGGVPASRIQIPPERPEGSVQITTSGITQARPDNSGKVDVIHVRMVVSNDGDDTPWMIDTRQQYLEIPGEGRTAPLFANSDLRTMPTLEIPRGESHVIDLFYPLPRNADERNLPQFDLVWAVETGTREVASRTSFDRQEVEPRVAYSEPYYWYAGWGPYWWYDPFWPGAGFVHARPIVIRGGFHHVGVGRFHGHWSSGGFHGGVAHRGGHR
jgi:hypothetical protein